jgi:hypothetical protein
MIIPDDVTREQALLMARLIAEQFERMLVSAGVPSSVAFAEVATWVQNARRLAKQRLPKAAPVSLRVIEGAA